MADSFVKVASLGDIAPGSVRKVVAGGRGIAVYNIDGSFYATSSVCPHQGGPLDEGMVEGDTVVCPWHAWVFDVRTGVSPVNPRAKIETFPVRIEGTDILIGV